MWKIERKIGSLKYYCNECGKDFDGSPIIKYETPNEELGQGVAY